MVRGTLLHGSVSSCVVLVGLTGMGMGIADAQAGTVTSEQKISETTGGFGGVLDLDDEFAWSVAAIDDLDGDGIGDLAVGVYLDDDGGSAQGAIWILFLNADGTVKAEQKISELVGGFGAGLDPLDSLGTSLAYLGDLDGDGVGDLASGVDGDDDGGFDQGALWIVFLNTDGTVKAKQKISETAGGFGTGLDPSDFFGTSVASLGDLDGDGVGDIAVGVLFDDDGGADRGAVWIVFLNTDGTVKSRQKISDTAGGFGGILANSDHFGQALAGLGDLDGDGIADLAVGEPLDDDGGGNQGAVWVLFLNADGTVKAEQKISETVGGFGGTLDAGDQFGFSLAPVGDLDGDAVVDLAVGAKDDDDGGSSQGAVWILFLNTDGTVKAEQKISETAGGFGGILDAGDLFGASLTAMGDHDGDGVSDLAVGAVLDDDGGSNQGAVWVLFLEKDTTPPIITCPADITEECASHVGNPVAFVVTATDNHDLSPAVVASPPSGSTFALGTTSVLCTATDDTGNASACSFDVTIVDTTPPVVACPADLTIECTNPGGEVVVFAPTATDVCDPAPSIVAVPPSGNTFALGTTTVTVTVTDASGNASVCTFDVTVQDTTDPVVTCPADLTVECTGPAGAVVGFVVTASDLCDPAPAVVSVPPSGSVFPQGTTTVTSTATDASGNASVCTFDVTVQDTTDPVVTCPADLTVECTGPAGATVVFVVTASDVCDPAPGIVSVPPSGSTFPHGTTTVTSTATDASGNAAVCTFDVTVQDTTPPVLVCPADLTIECTNPGGEVVVFAPSASDVCDPAPSIVAAPPSGSTFTLGTTTVTVTATDAAGNVSVCSFDVTIEDTTAPDVVCPADVTAECTSAGTAVVDFTVTASDLCDPAPAVVSVPASGSVFPVGTTTVTSTATDASGNAAVCSFDVTVEDTTPPVVTCPADLIVLVDELAPASGGPGAAASFSVSAVDGCDPAPALVAVPPSGSVFPWGTTTVTVTATDAEGNVALCTFDVTVRTDVPTFTGPSGSIVLLPALAELPDEPAERDPEDAISPPAFSHPPGEPLVLFELDAPRCAISDGSARRELFGADRTSGPATAFVDLARLFPGSSEATRFRLDLGGGRAGAPRFHGGAALRAGSGGNPLVLVSADTPRAGHAWTALVDVSGHPGASASVLFVATRPRSGAGTPHGELLVDLSGGPLLRSFVPSSGSVDLHRIPVPAAPAMAGLALHAQAAILHEGSVVLTNAIDLALDGTDPARSR